MRRIHGMGWFRETICYGCSEESTRDHKNGKASRATGIVKEHLAASPHGKQVILQIANEILDEKDMTHDWRTSTVVPIYKKEGSVMYCARWL